MEKDKNLVNVAKGGFDALGEPQFIIKVGEVYYLTVATLEYDSRQAVDEDEKEGCKEIERDFRQADHKYEAVKAPRAHDLYTACATRPPHGGGF